VAPDAGGAAIPAEWGGPHVEVVARITIEIALALQHAHERGVLHRDVKPSNILMDSSGNVRLIDFGLARIDAEPEFTRPGDFLGTPIYVAPEQIVGTRATVDARTDVYSLGVTLYELLTLKVPYEGGSTHELIQRITRSEPPAPRSFNASIPRDLETVCLTAIEKDPKRRYASAGELAADLQRALEFRPIRARPVGPIERFSRVVKRNPASSLASALAGVLVIGVPSLVALQQTRAAQNSRQVLDWALDAIAQYDPFSTQPGVVKDNEAAGPATSVAGLDRLAAKINAGGSYDAATRVKVSAALGRAYRGRGFNERSLSVLTAALDLARESWGEQSVEFAAVEHELGVTLRENGNYDGATARLEAALQKRERILGAHTVEVASTLHELGWARWMYSYGRGDEALPLFQRALDLRRELLGDADVSVAETRAALAVIVQPKEVDGSGLEQQEMALRLCTEALGENHPRTALVRANMGQTTRTLGQLARSEQLLEQAVAAFTAKLGREHSSTQRARKELYETYYSRGRYRSAEQMLRSVLPDLNPRADKPYTGDPFDLWELAVLLAHEDRVKEAEPLLNWAFTLPMRHALSVGEQIPAHSLAVMSEASGDFARAASFYATGLEFSIATQGAQSRVVAGDMVCLANALRELGETDAAERVLEQALDLCAELTARKGAGYCATAHVEALETLAAIRSEQLRYDEAAILLRECVKCRQAWPAARWEIGRAQSLLGECFARLDCCEEAEPLALDGFQQLSAQLAPEHEEYRRAQARLEFVRTHCAEHHSDTRGR
jgi:tetratricopeptide (TPR) repeat protein